MSRVLAPGSAVHDFVIVELAGDGTETNVYLASRAGSTYWLIQIESPAWEGELPTERAERSDFNGEHWVALPTGGTSMVNLASWVDRLELAFVGWRWSILARSTGYFNQRGQVLQNPHTLSLDRLVFNDAGELIFAQADGAGNRAYAFPPPEAGGTLTPASDVYSLGASLQAILGEGAPKSVARVLDKATAQDTAKRYPNAGEFGEALAQVLPNPNRVKAPQPPRSLFGWVRIGCIAVLVAIILVCSLIAYGTYRMVNSPEFQAEYSRMLQEQRELLTPQAK